MPTTASTAATPPPPPAPPRADTGPWQSLALIAAVAAILTARAAAARRRRIEDLRAEIERRATAVAVFAPGTAAHRLYAEEADAMAREIRALKASPLGLWRPRWGFALAVVALIVLLGAVTGSL